jgi:hypothetical protein
MSFIEIAPDYGQRFKCILWFGCTHARRSIQMLDAGYAMDEDILMTKWFPFKEVRNIPDVDKPGVYLLAHFAKNPRASNVSMSDNIIYIGETTKQTINARLDQFAGSAFMQKNGHSGGWTYSRIYLGEQQVSEVPGNLYVSIFSVDREEKESKAYIKYVERLLIWEYFKVQGDYPLCNTV